MRIATALFVPPIVFLTLISVGYAMVPWACETQRRFPLHLACAVALAVAAGCVVLAWRNWRSLGIDPPDDSPDVIVWVRFLAVLGLMLSALVTVGIVVTWIAQFVLAPCIR